MSDKIYYLATVPFESACQIDILPESHPASRLHGHSYLASVRVPVAPREALEQGDEPVALLREHLQSTIAPLNYAFLNDQIPTPTDENLARWVHQRIDLPGIDRIALQSTHDA